MRLRNILIAAGALLAVTATGAVADAIGTVEGARAKERQGRWLNRQDREQLRRWGGNDDYRYYRRPYGRYYGRGPGAYIYIDPY